jgi:hypothetical protein
VPRDFSIERFEKYLTLERMHYADSLFHEKEYGLSDIIEEAIDRMQGGDHAFQGTTYQEVLGRNITVFRNRWKIYKHA